MPGEDKLEERQKWKKTDTNTQRITVTTVSEKVLLTLMSCKTSKQMLDRLEAFYRARTDQTLQQHSTQMRELVDIYRNWKTCQMK